MAASSTCPPKQRLSLVFVFIRLSFPASCVDPARHVMGGPAAVGTPVVGHVRRARVHQNIDFFTLFSINLFDGISKQKLLNKRISVFI